MVDLSVGVTGVLAAAWMTALLGLLFGFFGLLLGAVSGRRAVVLGGGIGMAIAAFLLHVLAPMADWLEPWQKASPFYWALDSEPLLNGVDVGAVVLMVVVSTALLALTGLIFHRRDISGR